MPNKDWPFPKSNTVVGDAETFVKAARQKYAQDVANLTRAVVGREGRGFMQVPLSPEERAARFAMLRQSDTPEGWLGLLQSVQNDPAGQAKLTKWLRDSEAQYRTTQAEAQDTATQAATDAGVGHAPTTPAPTPAPDALTRTA